MNAGLQRARGEYVTFLFARRVYSGILESFDADTVTITEEGTPRTFARADIALIRLALDF